MKNEGEKEAAAAIAPPTAVAEEELVAEQVREGRPAGPAELGAHTVVVTDIERFFQGDDLVRIADPCASRPTCALPLLLRIQPEVHKVPYLSPGGYALPVEVGDGSFPYPQHVHHILSAAL